MHYIIKRKDLAHEAMWDHKEEVLNRLSTYVKKPFVDLFSKTLAYAWFEGYKEAEELAGKLDLDKKDFVACLEDIKGFEPFYFDEEEAKMVESYG